MRFAAGALAFLVLAAAGGAYAQALPPGLRSAGVNEAQWSQAQGVIRSQATALNLREDAVRTLAVEIFEAQPNQSFETYLGLIREGAARLPEALAAARALNPRGDAALTDLQRRAVAAAEAGRLREALALQDEYSETFRRALQRAAEAPQLDLAASYAAAGDTAFALSDYLGAAARYAQAAEAAPERATEIRWHYRRRQAVALRTHGYRFGVPASFAELVRVFETEVLPLAPRQTRPVDWAATQLSLGWLRVRQGERGDTAALAAAAVNFDAAIEVYGASGDRTGLADAEHGRAFVLFRQAENGAPGALERSIAAYEAALTAEMRESSPARWAQMQNDLGIALKEQGDRGVPGALERAVTAFEAALSVRTREADFAGWADTQMNLGNAFARQGERGSPGMLERGVAAYEAALTVMTRDVDPVGWAQTQTNIGVAQKNLGERGVAGALERSVEAFEAALTVSTRETDPAGWAATTYNLALTYYAMGRTAEARVTAQRALEGYEQVGNVYWAEQVRRFLARLPAQ